MKHVFKQSSVYTPRPQLSYEAEILGTGGCVNPLRSWLGSDELLIYNGDIVTDVDLPRLITQHRSHRPDATMVLLAPHRSGTTPVYWDGRNKLVAIGGEAPLGSQQATFSGIHILGPRLLQAIPARGFQNVIDAYQTVLKQGGRIEVAIHQGFWADLGQPQDYLQAHSDLLHAQERERISSLFGLHGIQWALAEESATVEQRFAGALRQSFLFGPVQIEGVQSIQRCIVYPGSQLSGQSTLRNRIITPDATLEI
jgi:mannose-1-phosphate guanylyltransferase